MNSQKNFPKKFDNSRVLDFLTFQKKKKDNFSNFEHLLLFNDYTTSIKPKTNDSYNSSNSTIPELVNTNV